MTARRGDQRERRRAARRMGRSARASNTAIVKALSENRFCSHGAGPQARLQRFRATQAALNATFGAERSTIRARRIAPSAFAPDADPPRVGMPVCRHTGGFRGVLSFAAALKEIAP